MDTDDGIPDADMRFIMSLMPRRWRDKHDPTATSLAVLDTYAAMEREGKEPEASQWVEGRSLFLEHVRPRIAALWAKYTRFAQNQLPLTDEALVSMWRKLQSASPEDRRRFHQEERANRDG